MLSPGPVKGLLLLLLPTATERLPANLQAGLSASSNARRVSSQPKPLVRAPSMLQAKSTLTKTVANATNSTSSSNESLARSHPHLPAAPLSFLQEDSVSQQESEPPLVEAPEAAFVELQEASEPEAVPISAPPLHEAAPDSSTVSGNAQQVLPLLLPVAGIAAGVHWWRLGVGFGVLLLAALVACTARFCCQRRAAASRLCQEVKKIRVSRGADLQSMFKLSREGQACQQPLRPGILTRVEGRVVTGQSASGALAAPFSGSECVYYSASVSQQRHDSIHQPPLAFHSHGRDFILETKDAPHVRINVSGSDVALFSMERGLREWQQAFAEAPKSWCSFVLEHLVPSTDASMHFKKCIDLGSDGVALEFRECALLADSSITCVGEVFRDKHGDLRLVPWQPQLVDLDSGDHRGSKPSKPWLQRAVPWLEGHGGRRRALGSAECLVGNVMVSDSLALKGNGL